MATHSRYGGVVPELASREHLRAIVPAVRMALEESSTQLEKLSAIAVTEGPGLVGSLLVGMTYGKALAMVHKLPLIAVNHIEGHIHAVASQSAVEFPALALVVSGGHTHLFEVAEGFRYRLLGKTRDDAAGEAFDKVAKLLGFGYPGGPVIDMLAPHGNPDAVRFTLAKMKGNTLDFSFSGLKTAVLHYVRKQGNDSRPLFTESEIADVCASFQRVVVTVLIDRLFDAARRYQAKGVGIAGGVSANSRLRAELQQYGRSREMPTFLPSLGLSTDNAAMIAAAGLRKFRAGITAPDDLNADASLTL